MRAAIAPTVPAADSPSPILVGDGRKGLYALGWMSLGQAVGLPLRLASNLILTRLLTPEMFGIIGPALAVLITLEWFCDLGVPQALVRDPRGGSPSFLHTGWWIGLFRGLVVSGVLAGLAWPLAEFYGRPELGMVLCGLAFLPLLQACRSPGLPVLRRRLEYRSLFADEIGQAIVAVTVTLLVAWVFHSLWAIVAGVLAGSISGVVISYVLCPVRPRRMWDSNAARAILGVSRQVLVNTLLMALWFNSDRLLGLRLVTLEQMGLYAVAWNLAGVLDTLVNRACDVYFSMLARTTDPEQRAKWHARVCSQLVLLAAPVLAIGVVLAPWIICVLYDVRYAAAGGMFALLVARVLFRGLGQVQFQFLLAGGRIRVATVAYAVALVVQAGLIVPLALRWGGLGLAISALVSTGVLAFVQSLLLCWQGRGRMAPFFITLGWVILALGLLNLCT